MSDGWITFETALGEIALAWQDEAITRLVLPNGTFDFPQDEVTPSGWVTQVVARIVRHLAGDTQEFSELPLAFPKSPAFHRTVYEAARRVPAGRTVTYGELASIVGSPGAARAVGQAMASNPIPLLMPCHRVVAANGKPGGFTAPGGLFTKAKLLEIERVRLGLQLGLC